MPAPIKNFYAIDIHTGNIVNATAVAKGNACDCICIKCGAALQARQGEHNRHHFKHITGMECKPETVLHLLAKRIFMECNYLLLPENKGRFEYTAVTEETWLVDQKPDIVLTGVTNNLHIEIAVTSFIDKTKKAKIVAKEYNTIEIDLSNLDRDTGYDNLKTILIEEIDRKEIIYWHKSNPMQPEPGKNNNWWKALGLAALAVAIWWLGRSKDKPKNLRKNDDDYRRL